MRTITKTEGFTEGTGRAAGSHFTRISSASAPKHWRFKRTSILLCTHLILLAAAYTAAFLLRFEFSLPDHVRSQIVQTLPWVLLLKLLVFQAYGSFRSRWRFVTFSDLASLIQTTVSASLAVVLVDYFLLPNTRISGSVLVLDWGISVLAFGGIRSASRIVRESLLPLVSTGGRRAVLMVGADAGGDAIVRQMHVRPELEKKYRVVGFLDNDPSNYGLRLGGVPFLGSTDDVVTISRRHQVKEVFVITGSLSGRHLRSLLSNCRQARIEVRMIPAVGKLLDGTLRLQPRDVDINDLLRRDPIKLDTELIDAMVDGHTIMVTGAGGSIGSEICRQIAIHRPKLLVLVERAENSLFHIERELVRKFPDIPCVACVADVCDEARLRVLFERYRPHQVFHAAAHKHVPLMECNAGEAVKNNVFGTKTVVDIVDEFEVERFILISTDKAVNPTSVMGLSKRFAERYIYYKSTLSKTTFIAVRFGNVLGSNGSVVPTFQDQIRRGGPVTVTHAEMRRFFMTIPEASQLVLQAAAIGNSGEILVLDMGEPVKIVDLARDMIRLSGFEPGEIETTFVGMRPGEKLYEEIYDGDERTSPTSHPKLNVVIPKPVDPIAVANCLSELEPVLNASEDVIFETLRSLLIDDLGANGRLCGSFARMGSRATVPHETMQASRHGVPVTPPVDR